MFQVNRVKMLWMRSFTYLRSLGLVRSMVAGSPPDSQILEKAAPSGNHVRFHLHQSHPRRWSGSNWLRPYNLQDPLLAPLVHSLIPPGTA
jgi:hypothetical protein